MKQAVYVDLRIRVSIIYDLYISNHPYLVSYTPQKKSTNDMTVIGKRTIVKNRKGSTQRLTNVSLRNYHAGMDNRIPYSL